MKRQRIGQSSCQRSYHRQLLHAISGFLPHRGLPLQSGDDRKRWTDRLLVVAAILMAWQSAPTLGDGFESCWQVVAGMYPTRRRSGHTHRGFIKALLKHSRRLVLVVVKALREAVQVTGGAYWLTEGWVVMGVDGTKVECPRTVANEEAFGYAGKDHSRPQQSLTAVLHVGTGLVWDWRRGVGRDAERKHLREMIASLPAKALLLADAGFTGYELLWELMEGGRNFIIRAGSNLRLLTKLGFHLREREGIVYLWPKKLRGKEPLVLRLVTLQDGPRPVHLLTSVLEESALSDGQAAAMYRLRWGIEVFYRSFKRTMAKHKLSSRSPAHAEVELDWAVVGLWMLGLLTLKRMIRRGISPMQWSVASSLRVMRQVMSGRCPRQAARDLHALASAIRDNRQRCGPKTTRPWPRKKTCQPPGPPNIRRASPQERQEAQRLRHIIMAA